MSKDINNNLYISQSMLTISGEGVLAGTPTFLIRLSYCNLSCNWCDTKYSWKHTNDLPGANIVDSLQFNNYIVDLDKSLNYHPRNLLLTGGEPLLYSDNELFWKLIKCYLWNTIEIETNGTLLNNNFLEKMNSILSQSIIINISPKLNTSFYPNINLYIQLKNNIKNLLNTRHLFQKFYFKFVYSEEDELIIDDFIQELKIPRNQILIMPKTPPMENNFYEVYNKTCLDTVRYCISKDYRFSPRLHVYLFGKDRTEKHVF